MGKTKIYTLLIIIPALLMLVTASSHSQSSLSDKPYIQEDDKGNISPVLIKHKVKKGDSLLNLAYMYRTSVQDIKDINNIERENIYLGENLNIPYNTKEYKGEESYIKYKVNQGDSLSVLASKFKTDIDSIKKINNLDGNQINFGQKLNIPYGIISNADSEDRDKMVVNQDVSDSLDILKDKDDEILNIQKDDSGGAGPDLSVAFTEKSIKDSEKYNNLENNLRKDLSKNKILAASLKSTQSKSKDVLPKGSYETDRTEKKEIEIRENIDPVETEGSSVDIKNENIEYVVNYGDNLSSIAEEYHATAAEIKELNNLDTNTLQPGQKISLPRHDFIRYRVKKGDNLTTLAAKNNITLKELKQINNLHDGDIYVGQRIKIPSEKPTLEKAVAVNDLKDSNDYSSQHARLNSSAKDVAENPETAINQINDKVVDANNIVDNGKIKDSINLKSDDSQKEVVDAKSTKDVEYKLYTAQITSDLDAADTFKVQGATNGNTAEIELDKTKDESDVAINATEKIDNSPVLPIIPEQKIKDKNDISGQKSSITADVDIVEEVNNQTDAYNEKSEISFADGGPDKINLAPVKAESGNESVESHVVVSGDSLSELAVTYDTTVKELKQANNLDKNRIDIGQKLLIPPASRISNIGDKYDEPLNIAEKEDETLSDSKVDDNDVKVSDDITEALIVSESETDSTKIKEKIRNLADNKSANDNFVQMQDSKTEQDSITDNLAHKDSELSKVKLADPAEQVVKKQENIVENKTHKAEVITKTVKNEAESLTDEAISKDEPDNAESEIKPDISEIKPDIKDEHYTLAESNQLTVSKTDIAKKIVPASDTKTPDIPEMPDIPEEDVKISNEDLQYKSDMDADMKNKVSLAQLLTLEESSVASEEDRYHTLVEEQVLLAKNDDGDDSFVQRIDVPSNTTETTESGEEIVNFPGEIDLRDLVQTMSEITNESFIIDDSLQAKKVTIITPKGGFSKSNAIRLFEAILDLNGFTVYRNGAINVVTEKRDIKSVPLPIQEGRVIGTLSERFITQIVPLKNIKAQDVANALKPLISREGDIVVYDPLNTLIIVETKTNINKILTILDNIDKEKEIIFVKIYNSDAADISAMLTEIFGGISASPVTSAADEGDTRTRRRATTRGAARGQQSSSAGGEVDVTAFKIITDERTNSLIVIAYPEDIPKIKAAIERLDVRIDEPEHGIYVIRLKNADAEQVVNVLNSLISGVPLPSSTADTGTNIGTARTSVRNTQTAAQSSTGVISDFEIEDVRLTADAATNSVIIVGSRREFESIKRVVDEIDIRRKQVYVEAAILEVALDQLKSLGTNLSLGFTFDEDNLGFGGTNLPGVPSILGAAVDPENTVNVVGSLSGMFLGVIGEEVDPDGSGPIPPIPSFTALFQALTSVTDVNILSTPSIVTTDNEEAEIVVADVIPFPTGSTVGDSGVTVETIDREPVGIRLAITPQIGDGDFLNLQLVTEVSNVKDSPPDLNTEEFGITTSTRTATSSVVVKNGQTIVIGGLVQDREGTSENKVPALGDIPVLGNLFKFKSRQSQKINLMILLTPRIVNDEKDMRLILEDRQKRNMLLQEKNIEEERLLLE